MISKKKILVIEDEISVLENIVEILDDSRFIIYTAINGQFGVESARKYLPDLVVCDIMMPKMSGFDVLNTLKKDEVTASIPFIFLSAKTDPKDIKQGMNLGADDYITKPFTNEELLNSVNKRLQRLDSNDSVMDKHLNELKISLAALIPHKLRIPLNAILASAQFIIDSKESIKKEDIDNIYDTINLSAQQMQRMLVNMLLYINIDLYKKDKLKIAESKEILTKAPADLVREIFYRQCKKYNRENDLIFKLSDAEILMLPEHFYKVCEELCDNAIKFSKKGTDIAVTTVAKMDFYSIKVTDRGRGIGEEELNNIRSLDVSNFDLFDQQSTGLGLATIKKIVELYGGKFSIESEWNSYASITVMFPVKSPVY